MIVYQITNLINSKVYVGKTTRALKQRVAEHKSRKDRCLGRAFEKYGFENFKIEVLAECDSLEELNKLETFWIKKLNSNSHSGYNLTEGGDGAIGYKPSAKTIAKRSAALKGRKFSAEHRAKIAEANRRRSAELIKQIADKNRGQKRSAETRAKISECAKHRSSETRAKLSRANIGKKLSLETRKKISEKNKLRHQSEETRAKIGLAHRGKKLSVETKAKISATKRKNALNKA